MEISLLDFYVSVMHVIIISTVFTEGCAPDYLVKKYEIVIINNR